MRDDVKLDAIERAIRSLLDRDPSTDEVDAARRRLADGGRLADELLAIARSDERLDRCRDRCGPLDAGDDDAFVTRAFRQLLGRDPDPDGLRHYAGLLAHGHSRKDLVALLASSDESVNQAVADVFPLPDLIQQHPNRYRDVPKVDRSETVPCVEAHTDDDFDWLVQQIGEHDYYERPGIWGFSIDTDKRVLAEILACFGPRRALDLGCANGTVMKCLYDLGITSEGVELSSSAIGRAFPEIRAAIHHGDVTKLELPRRFDLVYGFDIFEHVPPRALPAIIRAMHDTLVPGGFVFANIPAFGDDPGFGEVFTPYLDEWVEASAAGRPFSLLHVDDHGFPLHGHLIWADTRWWTSAFTTAGFERQLPIETAIRHRYAHHFESFPARRSFYVFSNGASAERVAEVVAQVEAGPPSGPGPRARLQDRVRNRLRRLRSGTRPLQ